MSLSTQSQMRTSCAFSSARPCRPRAKPLAAIPQKQDALKPSGDETVSATCKLGLGLATSAVMLMNVFTGPVLAHEVASIAESGLDDAVEAVRTLVPSPDGLLDKEKAAQKAEAQEKRAAESSGFKPASPVGGEGEVSNLADQGLKGGAQFEAAAKKLNTVDSEAQYANATEVDKMIQKEDDYKKAKQFKDKNPGSSTGNSVVDRSTTKIAGGGDAPGKFSFFGLGK